MKFEHINVKYKVYQHSVELSELDMALIGEAIKMLDFAYAPYSNFHVGAAARLTDGSIYTGTNQENASYPLCMCAERVALYNAAVHKPSTGVDALAIVVRNPHNPVMTPASPCGACRQVIAEFENRYNHPIRLLLKAESDVIFEFDNMSDLLPLGFNGSFL
ncbi:MAG: cytidine deaminase [Saprospiraceae bacterium]|nr:cytidine deaminase [Saprospiraceae bacterium]